MQRAHSASDIAAGHPACYADHVTERGIARAETGRPVRLGERIMSLLVRPTPPPLWLGLVVAAGVIGVETVVVVLRKHLAPTMAFGIVYLLGVLLVGTVWGFGLAAITALASAVAFDICRRWPDGFVLGQLQSWVVVGVFFVVAVLCNSLAGLARASAIEADRRRHEADLAARQQTALRRVATEGTIEKHVRSILNKLNLPETADDHRRVRAVITFLESRDIASASAAHKL
jgi:K+-sensing histidine kinase KdpD